MKVSKILHPEIVLGKRGDRTLIRLISRMVSEVDHIPDRGWNLSPIVQGLDHHVKEHWCMLWKFKRELPKTYFIPKDFSEALQKIDGELPLDLLPKRWFGYIAFGDGALFDETDEVQGAYVFIGPGKETIIRPEAWEKPHIWISYVCKDTVNRKDPEKLVGVIEHKATGQLLVTGYLGVGKLLTNIEKMKISNLLDRVPHVSYLGSVLDGSFQKIQEDDSRSQQKQNAVFRTIINAALYINSINADLFSAPTTNHLSIRQKREREKSGKPVNECTIPVTLVSWNYQKPRVFTKDKTWIDTFMRWQRCGPDYSQVKLIWVAPHERNFKTVRKENEDGSQTESTNETISDQYPDGSG